jgi:hypothetical protein
MGHMLVEVAILGKISAGGTVSHLTTLSIPGIPKLP